MAYSKLIDCDKSDMSKWAHSTPAKNFVREVGELRSISFRKLLKEGAAKHDENASTIRAYDKILSLIEEAKKTR